MFAIEVTTKHNGTYRLRTMCYNGVDYRIDPTSKEVRLASEEEALKLVEKLVRLGGLKAIVVPAGNP